MNARIEHLVDECGFVCGDFGVAVADFVDVSPVKVRRNLLDAFLRVDGDVDGGGRCGRETRDGNSG